MNGHDIEWDLVMLVVSAVTTRLGKHDSLATALYFQIDRARNPGNNDADEYELEILTAATAGLLHDEGAWDEVRVGYAAALAAQHRRTQVFIVEATEEEQARLRAMKGGAS